MTRYTNIMLDLETLSTQPDAVIVSLGAVKFELHSADSWPTLEEPRRSMYCVFEITPQLEAGAHISPDTIKWWMEQEKQARAVFQAPSQNNWGIVDQFNRFCDGAKYLWGNGCNFDNPILRNFYKRYNVIFPIPFYGDRDLRTLKMLGEVANPLMENISFPPAQTAHNALADAKIQVIRAQTYYQALFLHD